MVRRSEDDPVARLEARAAEARLMIERTRIRLAQAEKAIARVRDTVPARLAGAKRLRELAYAVRENLRQEQGNATRKRP